MEQVIINVNKVVPTIANAVTNVSAYINKLIGDLKKHAYKDRIISECASEFYIEKFEEKFEFSHFSNL